MVIQDRSARTRRRLVLAAAAEFDENGYERATLARICKSAAASMGALTFHFASKRQLADAVRSDARDITRDRMRELAPLRGPALISLADLTVGLVQLLETEVVVRSAARLARECPGGDAWTGVWLPLVRRLVEDAERCRELRPGLDPQLMTALVVHLVAGAEASLRAEASLCAGTHAVPAAVATRLERMWEVVLRGAAA